MEYAQNILSFVSQVMDMISRNWEVFSALLLWAVSNGYISNKNGELIGKVFDREMGMKSLEIEASMAGITPDTALSFLPKVKDLVGEVLDTAAKETPMAGATNKDKAETFAKEIILNKIGVRDSASLDISKEVKLVYKDGKPEVQVSGMSNKIAYKAKKFLKKVF